MKCDRCERDATVFPPVGYGWPGSFCAECYSRVEGPFSPWSQGPIDAPLAIGPFFAASYGLGLPTDGDPSIMGTDPRAPPPTPEPRLRPCPWCGSPADQSGHWACVMCSRIDCSFVGPDPDPTGTRWNEVAGRLKRDRVAEVIRYLVARHRATKAERDHLREQLIDERQRRRRAERGGDGL